MSEDSWKSMHIAKSTAVLSTCLSTEEIPVTLEDGLSYSVVSVSSCEKMSPELLNEMSTFISSQNRTKSGNITCLSPSSILSWMRAGSRIAIMRDETHFRRCIVGTIISLPLRCDLKLSDSTSSTMEMGNTNFLCIHERYRERGLAMKLIKAILLEGNHIGVLLGYYLTFTPHHPCHLEVRSWSKLIDPVKALSGGFVPLDCRNMDTVTRSCISSPPLLFSYCRCTSGERVLNVISSIPSPGISWNPTLEEAQRVASNFNVFEIRYGITSSSTSRNSSIETVGVVIINVLSVQVRGAKAETNVAWLSYLLFNEKLVDVNNVLFTVASISESLDVGVLYGFNIGQLHNLHDVSRFSESYNRRHPILEFYNCSFTPQASLINIPLI